MFIMVPPDNDALRMHSSTPTDRKLTESSTSTMKYTTHDGIPLHIQLIYPAAPTPPAGEDFLITGAPCSPPRERQSSVTWPLVVFVEGSAWMKQDCYRAADHGRRPPRLCRGVRGVQAVRRRRLAGLLLDVKAAIRYSAQAELY